MLALAAQRQVALHEARFDRLSAQKDAERASRQLDALLAVSNGPSDAAHKDARAKSALALVEARGRLSNADAKLTKAEAASRTPLTTKYAPRPLEFPRAKTTYRDTPSNAPYRNFSTGRRLALARWIVDRRNPLTARVAVNHIWARHFGEPLVGSMYDFGLRSPRPVHHELLDWLAVEFMESGWSFKQLHRLILTSRAYQMSASGTGPSDSAIAQNNLPERRLSPRERTFHRGAMGDDHSGPIPKAKPGNHFPESRPSLREGTFLRVAKGDNDSRPAPESAAIDSDNQYFWRMNEHRMEGEVVRDCILNLAGSLDCKIGGPDQPVAAAETGNRRTIYYRYASGDNIPLLSTFDAANVTECYRRYETIVPQQALALTNSAMVLTRAAEIAALIEREVGSRPTARPAFVAAVFERVLGRLPTDAERAECLSGLVRLATTFAAEPKSPLSAEGRARSALVHVLLNHNDFVSIR
jgi:hypothetical protein